MTIHTADRILHALFRLSRDTRHIDATALGRATGHSATQAAQALVLLEKHGWVDVSRARLTLTGLARAVQLEAKFGGGGLRTTGSASPRGARATEKLRRKPPLAAAPRASNPPAARRRPQGVEVDPRSLARGTSDACGSVSASAAS